MADNIILYIKQTLLSKSNADCFGFLFRFYYNSQPRKKRYAGFTMCLFIIFLPFFVCALSISHNLVCDTGRTDREYNASSNITIQYIIDYDININNVCIIVAEEDETFLKKASVKIDD